MLDPYRHFYVGCALENVPQLYGYRGVMDMLRKHSQARHYAYAEDTHTGSSQAYGMGSVDFGTENIFTNVACFINRI